MSIKERKSFGEIAAAIQGQIAAFAAEWEEGKPLACDIYCYDNDWTAYGVVHFGERGVCRDYGDEQIMVTYDQPEAEDCDIEVEFCDGYGEVTRRYNITDIRELQ